RREHVPVRPWLVADPAGRYCPRPAGDERDADAPLVEIALDAAQPAGALEILGRAAAFLVRAVVADEHQQRAALDAERAQAAGDRADIPVHADDHRGERRLGRLLRAVAERDIV